ncbi:MAG: hypothetical protein EA356_12165 [Geminicoccaceae bacterium]|nr:MAG: hypothetical protein EA356_12165 [Geminicoccaceae bacterium]
MNERLARRLIDWLPTAVVAAFLLIGLYVVWTVQGYRLLGARLFPEFVGIAAAVLAAAELIRQAIVRLRGPRPAATPDFSDLAGEAGDREPAFYRRGLTVFAWIALLYLLTLAIGFVLAVPLWIVVLLRFVYRTPWLPTLATAAGLVLLMATLQITLRVRLPLGYTGISFM